MLNLIVASALAAASPAQATAAAAAESGGKDERKICETYQETGSRLGKKRVCRTAQQWQERRRADRGELERAQSNVGQAATQ